MGRYRFDKGPSLFTLPELLDELSELVGQEKITRTRLQNITNYFFEDGSRVSASYRQEEFAETLQVAFGEDKENVLSHLRDSAYYYDVTAPVFLERGLSRPRDLLNFKTLKALLHAPRLPLNSTMHQRNNKRFRDKRTVQIFNRYATYNGSDPYQAPALLNIIPHLEFGRGAFLPENGMHDITLHLLRLAKSCGVDIRFNHPVSKILTEADKVKGVISNGHVFEAPVVLSDADMHFVYRHLLPREYTPHKMIQQQKSSSAFVFYWGINRKFEELDVHNILFSQDYRKEFNTLFSAEEPDADPTVYINITSKLCPADAPAGCENWFVMVNVPHNQSQQPVLYGDTLRANVIRKINRMLKTDIEKHIEVEETLDPFAIETQTSSVGGSLYGNASNNRFSAFLRHANFSSKIKGLYFAGGSVHPGGGIPLCLMSAKIVTDIIRENYAN